MYIKMYGNLDYISYELYTFVHYNGRINDKEIKNHSPNNYYRRRG